MTNLFLYVILLIMIIIIVFWSEKMKKYSRQREAVYEAVCSVRSHPTADEVYDSVKKKLPNVSLATVYRNLSLLCSEGKLIMINTGEDRKSVV